eukprot:scaffold9874_cov51-Cyclotella_meneghiniana.AAC.2
MVSERAQGCILSILDVVEAISYQEHRVIIWNNSILGNIGTSSLVMEILYGSMGPFVVEKMISRSPVNHLFLPWMMVKWPRLMAGTVERVFDSICHEGHSRTSPRNSQQEDEKFSSTDSTISP